MKFDRLYDIIAEAEVLPVINKKLNTYVYPEDRKPLKDTDVIRVYHAFNDQIDAIRTLKYGVSGKERTNRRYSYEANNNPHGLFVTISLDIAKKFGNHIIEIHTKVADLESPVWPGGGYTVQGQMAEYFDTPKDREEARMKCREEAKKSKYDAVKNSDRPELAELLLTSGEQQALFTGELNSNSVRAIWINSTPEKDGSYSTFKRMKPAEFIKQFGHKDKIMKRDWQSGEYKEMEDDTKLKRRILKPRDKFDIKVFLDKLYKDSGYDPQKDTWIIDTLKTFGDSELLRYVWPNQLEDAKREISKLS